MVTDEKGGSARITIADVHQSNGVIQGRRQGVDAELTRQRRAADDHRPARRRLCEAKMINDRLVYHHRLWVRLTHWINVVCMTCLLMSGLQIFNAHPALYWGNASNFDHPLLAIAGFPDWVTLPGSQWLSMGRRWHFFFAWLFVANGMAYALLAVFRGHLRSDLLPSARELHGIGHSVRQHLRLRFPK